MTQLLPFLEADIRLRENGHQSLLRKITQDIPAQFLDRLKDKRAASLNAPMGDMHHVASIPESVVLKWMGEGFNVFDQNVTVQEIIARLRVEDMGDFMATERTIR